MKQNASAQRGAALILVLWLVAALSLTSPGKREA